MAHVLVVEDEKDIRDLAVLILEQIGGHTVTTARNSQEAQKALSGEKFDVVMMDRRFPSDDNPAHQLADDDNAGIKIVQQMQSTEGHTNQGTPVIMCSATTASIDVTFSNIKADVVTKPYDPKNLLEKITQATQVVGEHAAAELRRRATTPAAGAAIGL